MTSNETKGGRLQTLTKSDYAVADGQPDIRGWDVRDRNANHLGKVEELIFDVQSRKVRYMVVSLDKGAKKERLHDVLVPIGLAELHNIDNDAFLLNITREQLTALPRYEGNIDAGMENAVRAVLGGGIAGAAMDADTSSKEDPGDFYNHEHFNENNLFKNRKEVKQPDVISLPVINEELHAGKQTVQTGATYLRSRIVEQAVEETVTLHQEKINVVHTPADRVADTTDFDTFKEGVIELKEYAEVPVISKESRVVEEVTIGKDITERNEVIHETVRSTKVDIEEIHNDNKKYIQRNSL